MSAPQLPLDVLVAARELLSVPERWTRWAYARSKHGLPVSSREAAAVCWCSIGAIHRINPPLTVLQQALRLLEASINPGRPEKANVSAFNDAPSTTHADVLAAFDRAIAAERERGNAQTKDHSP